jgi:lipopolysaccharide transport system ATP-binding protein
MSSQATSHSPPATDSDEVLVRVQGVSKKFCRSLKRSLWYGLCDIGGELNPFRRQVAEVAGSGLLLAGNGSKSYSSELATSNSPLVTPAAAARDEDLRDGEFYAVRDVSFELRRGECLGLIGHNGAGKTTLLKMLNGLIKPDTGRIEMNGRVGALIALGAGFNPILTGRENIYINGAVLGLSKAEIEENIDDIIDFAEIREFIDMPVQSYSSGMAVRLGFSVASSLNPDVLILDEVLAVGDMKFVVKCLNRLRSLASKASVILVSHNTQMIAGFSSRVLMLSRGTVIHDTYEPMSAIKAYEDLSEVAVTTVGTGGVTISECSHMNQDNSLQTSTVVILQGEQAKLQLKFTVLEHVKAATLQINIVSQDRTPIIAVPVISNNGKRKTYQPGKYTESIHLGKIELTLGNYSCTAIFRSPHNDEVLNRSDGIAKFSVSGTCFSGAAMVRPALSIS